MSSKITVVVRVRPLNEREKELNSSPTLFVRPGEISVTRKLDGYSKAFNFDLAYSAEKNAETFGSQSTLYKDIGLPILEEALKGINQCLFAYGQTGSGKSYTMTGYEDPGIIPRLTEDLFRRVSQSSGSIKVWVSYMEIYNERIRDLLRQSESEESLSIFEHDRLGVIVPDATMSPISTYEEAKQIMTFGLSRRVSASTQMNEASSRSHAICTLHIQTQSALSRINLIDLAGSERISKSEVTGDNRREASMINQSLTNLGIVIKALSEKKDFVPFRNSKLTFLLKDSLSGNSRTYMVANISPSESEVEETISTLRFASNVKRVVTDPHVNYGTQEDMINALRSEIAHLKDQLAQSPVSPRMGAQLKVRSAVLKMIDASISEKVEKRISTVNQEIVVLPYLVNVSSDPLRVGVFAIVFHKADVAVSVGSGAETDQFVLKGANILPCMARLVLMGSGTIQVTLTNAIAQVLVNGAPLAINQSVNLGRNDLVQFGTACKFRLVDPNTENLAGESGGDSEFSFVLSNYVCIFPHMAPETVRNLESILSRISAEIDARNSGSDDELFSLRLMLPSGTQTDPELLIAVERVHRSSGVRELMDVTRFRHQHSSKTTRPELKELISLLETAKSRLDSIHAKNQDMLRFN